MSETEMRKGWGTGSMLLAFLWGAVAGGAAALLLAPRSGEQTRKRLAEMADSGREKAVRVPVAVREASHAASAAFSQAMKEPS